MKKAWAAAAMVAMSIACTGGVEEEGIGELTDRVCFEGVWDTQAPLSQPRRLGIVSNGTLSMRLGRVKLCDERSCIEDGEVLETSTFDPQVGGGSLFEFELVFQDDDFTLLRGVPDDFRLDLPQGWVDVRPENERVASSYRVLDVSGGSPSGDIVMEAFGRTHTFTIEASQ